MPVYRIIDLVLKLIPVFDGVGGLDLREETSDSSSSFFSSFSKQVAEEPSPTPDREASRALLVTAEFSHNRLIWQRFDAR